MAESMNCRMEILEGGCAPKRATAGSAGYDIFARIPDGKITVPSGSWKLISGGFKVELYGNLYGKIEARSGLAFKHGIRIGAGVIDTDYKGEVGVVFFNHGPVDFEVNNGDRVAQIVFMEYKAIEFEIKKVETAKVGERGEGGFGSTGK